MERMRKKIEQNFDEESEKVLKKKILIPLYICLTLAIISIGIIIYQIINESQFIEIIYGPLMIFPLLSIIIYAMYLPLLLRTGFRKRKPNYFYIEDDKILLCDRFNEIIEIPYSLMVKIKIVDNMVNSRFTDYFTGHPMCNFYPSTGYFNQFIIETNKFLKPINLSRARKYSHGIGYKYFWIGDNERREGYEIISKNIEEYQNNYKVTDDA